MKNQVLVKRYTQGFINSIKDEQEYKILWKQLIDIRDFLLSHKELDDILRNPFLSTSKKMGIAKEVIHKVLPDSKASRLFMLLMEKDRFEIFPDIMEFIPDMWNEEKGVSTFEVYSVVPLNETQKKKLSKKLERLENKTVTLKYRTDPALLGGLSIRKGNIVYDVSIRGDLLKLKEKIIEG
jgi:F-type H+-transporting ATPase subunit delta